MFKDHEKNEIINEVFNKHFQEIFDLIPEPEDLGLDNYHDRKVDTFVGKMILEES